VFNTTADQSDHTEGTAGLGPVVDRVIEADLRLAAVERILRHGVTCGDVYPLEECVDQAIVLVDVARQWLGVRAA
jgi:hypothetical protein